MKTTSMLFALLPTLVCFNALAQTTPCEFLQVLAIQQDSINPNVYQVSMAYNAPQNDILSYPFITGIVNCNGDTIATGSAFFFGQPGQSIQDYEVTATGDISCGPLTILFHYLSAIGDEDTCVLTFSVTQSFECSRISIVGITPDSTNTAGHILTFEADGSGLSFAEAWTYALNIYDCNGELLSSTASSWFGFQPDIIITQQVYIDSFSSSSCLPLTVEFILSDPVADTCLINFTPTSVGSEKHATQDITIFPNPAGAFINIRSEIRNNDLAYALYDAVGRLIRSGMRTGTNTILSLSGLPEGVYMLVLQERPEQFIKVVKL